MALLKSDRKNCLIYKLGLENNKRQQRWISNISSNFKFTIKGLAIHLLYAESKAFWLVWKWSHDLKQSIRIHELKRIVNCSWNIFIGLGLFYLLSTICCNPCSSLSCFHNLANSCFWQPPTEPGSSTSRGSSARERTPKALLSETSTPSLRTTTWGRPRFKLFGERCTLVLSWLGLMSRGQGFMCLQMLKIFVRTCSKLMSLSQS